MDFEDIVKIMGHLDAANKLMDDCDQMEAMSEAVTDMRNEVNEIRLEMLRGEYDLEALLARHEKELHEARAALKGGDA